MGGFMMKTKHLIINNCYNLIKWVMFKVQVHEGVVQYRQLKYGHQATSWDSSVHLPPP